MSCSCSGALPGSGASSTSQCTTVSTSVCGKQLRQQRVADVRADELRALQVGRRRAHVEPGDVLDLGRALEPARELRAPEARDAGDQDAPAHQRLAARARVRERLPPAVERFSTASRSRVRAGRLWRRLPALGFFATRFAQRFAVATSRRARDAASPVRCARRRMPVAARVATRGSRPGSRAARSRAQVLHLVAGHLALACTPRAPDRRARARAARSLGAADDLVDDLLGAVAREPRGADGRLHGALDRAPHGVEARVLGGRRVAGVGLRAVDLRRRGRLSRASTCVASTCVRSDLRAVDLRAATSLSGAPAAGIRRLAFRTTRAALPVPLP